MRFRFTGDTTRLDVGHCFHLIIHGDGKPRGKPAQFRSFRVIGPDAEGVVAEETTLRIDEGSPMFEASSMVEPVRITKARR